MQPGDVLRITRPDDMHCHLRGGEIMRSVVGFTASQFGRAVIMPNLTPAILTAENAIEYRGEIVEACHDQDLDGFSPLMTIQINDGTTPDIIKKAKQLGVIAGKVYPQGVTTNSSNGVADFKVLYPAFQEMEDCGMLLLIHGETPNPAVFCLDREEKFLSTLATISRLFPKLKIVLEHITTSAAVSTVKRLDNAAATITIHHLMLTLDDVVGNMLSPHNFCKPIAKRPEDRMALREAAISGNSKFFYGGDSAPHLKNKKECCQGCAGVFNAPVAMAALAQIFEELNSIYMLDTFASRNGAAYYGLPRNPGMLKLVKEDWIVPLEYDGIVPFMAGQTLHWKVLD